jgi:hypothetical protein
MENPKKSPSKCNFAIIFTMQHVHQPFFGGQVFALRSQIIFFEKVSSFNLEKKLLNFLKGLPNSQNHKIEN